MHLGLRKFRLRLRHTFSISRESRDFQDTLVVALSLNGKTGYGEATSNPYYNITLSGMVEEIEAISNDITEYEFDTPEAFHVFVKGKGLSNFALCALDLAANDLYGKLLDKPLYAVWGTNNSHYPITNYTIGIDTVDKMVAKMKETPWPIYKIKLGTNDDLGIIRALRTQTDAVFRIDANCAWTAPETISIAPELKKLGVEFIEQPLKANDWDGMEQVNRDCVLPVIADESCILEEDVVACAGYFTGINIKLTKCGGLTPARRMIAQARKLGLKTMVGCMTESTVGISAIAQLLPQLDYVDMDGAMLLDGDIADGVKIGPTGKVAFPTIGGSGIRLRDEAILGR